MNSPNSQRLKDGILHYKLQGMGRGVFMLVILMHQLLKLYTPRGYKNNSVHGNVNISKVSSQDYF